MAGIFLELRHGELSLEEELESVVGDASALAAERIEPLDHVRLAAISVRRLSSNRCLVSYS